MARFQMLVESTFEVPAQLRDLDRSLAAFRVGDSASSRRLSTARFPLQQKRVVGSWQQWYESQRKAVDQMLSDLDELGMNP